jgi:aminomethyltransferase
VPTLRTPLHDRHRALGGRLVNFGGWEMPQQYTSIRDEHHAVRTVAGLFDISHMGRFRIRGERAFDFLQGLLTNDLARIGSGQAQYTLMCDETGGVLDDLVVYWDEEGLMTVVNAANRERDLGWMRQHAPAGVEVEDRTFELALIALQGPRAEELLPARGLSKIPYFGFQPSELAGVRATVARTGYTGEDGFELFVAADNVGRLWDSLLESGRAAGLLPCGLGARDACRLEAALRLYGSDMDESVNPYEAGLGWTVRLKKGDFVGSQALARVKQAGPARELVGLRSLDRSIPRHGSAVHADGRRIGQVTSGTYSFWLNQGLGLALVEAGSAPLGSRIEFESRGQAGAAEVVQLPFYRGSVHSPAATGKAERPH